MHKQFRMIAIAEYLHSQGFGPSTGEHMQIPGIWKKLGTLYNLEALDERVSLPTSMHYKQPFNHIFVSVQEDSIFTGSNEEEDGESERYCPFELPYEEYGDLMFERRLADEGSSSPISSIRGESPNGSTVADTDGEFGLETPILALFTNSIALSEPASSPAPSRAGRKSNRGTRKRATRSSKIQVEIETDSQDKGSEGDAGSDEDTGGNEEEEEGEEGSEREESEAEEAEEEKGGSRSTRASRSKPKDKKPTASTTTRRTGRRR